MSAILALFSAIGPLLARFVEPASKLLALWGASRAGRARGKAEAQRDQALASEEHQAAGGEHARDHAALDRDELVRRAREQAGRE